jgi:hypothetical protein
MLEEGHYQNTGTRLCLDFEHTDTLFLLTTFFFVFLNPLHVDSIYIKFIEYTLMISHISHICNYSLTNNIPYVMWGYVMIHLGIKSRMATMLLFYKLRQN